MHSYRRMRSSREIGTVFLFALTLAGCATRGDIDVLEAELRQQEQSQQELAEQLAQARDDLKVARSDAAVLRSQVNRTRQVSLTQEQADVLYRAEGLKFNMLLTSGQNRDGQPGDDGLSVMLTPVDVHGDLVKLVGEVELELFDMTLDAANQRLGGWKFSTEEVRDRWHRGFVGSGYLFQVDWQRFPAASELTLHARFRVPHGSQFDATTQVKVDPPSQKGPPIARGSDSGAPRRAQARTVNSDADQSRRVVPAYGKTTARKPVGASVSAPPRSNLAVAPEIRPQSQSGPAAQQSIKTSDSYTDDTLPVRR
jgi:outer membrane murein-binding lipoprotein Lpp